MFQNRTLEAPYASVDKEAPCLSLPNLAELGLTVVLKVDSMTQLMPRYDWTRAEIAGLYEQSFLSLIHISEPTRPY